eukprot:TRINITY_DN6191_c0_g1_i1.p1 TRINITY_DN6191_c0_g1~~TRINITY_DN6191_c0_g1_i1.p1  ORF type:complete len:853 (-),score=289.74 TRINITY_DN6191_c0_g1_i1:109-2667(-)
MSMSTKSASVGGTPTVKPYRMEDLQSLLARLDNVRSSTPPGAPSGTSSPAPVTGHRSITPGSYTPVGASKYHRATSISYDSVKTRTQQALDTTAALTSATKDVDQDQANLSRITQEIKQLDLDLEKSKQKTRETQTLLSQKEQHLREKVEKEKLRHEMQMERLRARLDELQRAGKAESAEHRELRLRLQQEQAENEKVLLLRRQIQADLAALRAKLEAEASEKAELEQRAQQKELERQALNKRHAEQVTRLQKQLEDAIMAEQEKKAELEKKRAQTHHLNQDRDAAAAKAAGAALAVSLVVESNVKVEKEITTSTKQRDRHVVILEEEKKREEERRFAMNRAAESLRQAKLAFELATNEKEFHRAIYEDTVKEMQETAAEVKTDVVKVVQQEHEIKELEKRRNELDETIEDTQDTTVAAVEAVHERKASEISSVSRAHATTKNRLLRSGEEYAGDIAAATAALELKQKQHETLTLNSAQLGAQVNAMDRHIEQETGEAHAIRQGKRELDAELAKATSLISGAQKMIAHYEQLAVRRNAKHSSAKRHIEANKQAKANLENSADAVRKDLDVAMANLGDRNKERARAAAEVSGLQGRLADGQVELEAAQRDADDEVSREAKKMAAEKARASSRNKSELRRADAAVGQRRTDAGEGEAALAAVKEEADTEKAMALRAEVRAKEAARKATIAASDLADAEAKRAALEADADAEHARAESAAKEVDSAVRRNAAAAKSVAERRRRANDAAADVADTVDTRALEAEDKLAEAYRSVEDARAVQRKLEASAEEQRLAALGSDSDEGESGVLGEARAAAKQQADAAKAKAAADHRAERRRQAELEALVELRRTEMVETHT